MKPNQFVTHEEFQDSRDLTMEMASPTQREFCLSPEFNERTLNRKGLALNTDAQNTYNAYKNYRIIQKSSVTNSFSEINIQNVASSRTSVISKEPLEDSTIKDSVVGTLLTNGNMELERIGRLLAEQRKKNQCFAHLETINSVESDYEGYTKDSVQAERTLTDQSSVTVDVLERRKTLHCDEGSQEGSGLSKSIPMQKLQLNEATVCGGRRDSISEEPMYSARSEVARKPVSCNQSDVTPQFVRTDKAPVQSFYKCVEERIAAENMKNNQREEKVSSIYYSYQPEATERPKLQDFASQPTFPTSKVITITEERENAYQTEEKKQKVISYDQFSGNEFTRPREQSLDNSGLRFNQKSEEIHPGDLDLLRDSNQFGSPIPKDDSSKNFSIYGRLLDYQTSHKADETTCSQTRGIDFHHIAGNSDQKLSPGGEFRHYTENSNQKPLNDSKSPSAYKQSIYSSEKLKGGSSQKQNFSFERSGLKNDVSRPTNSALKYRDSESFRQTHDPSHFQAKFSEVRKAVADRLKEIAEFEQQVQKKSADNSIERVALAPVMENSSSSSKIPKPLFKGESELTESSKLSIIESNLRQITQGGLISQMKTTYFKERYREDSLNNNQKPPKAARMRDLSHEDKENVYAKNSYSENYSTQQAFPPKKVQGTQKPALIKDSILKENKIVANQGQTSENRTTKPPKAVVVNITNLTASATETGPREVKEPTKITATDTKRTDSANKADSNEKCEVSSQHQALRLSHQSLLNSLKARQNLIFATNEDDNLVIIKKDALPPESAQHTGDHSTISSTQRERITRGNLNKQHEAPLEERTTSKTSKSSSVKKSKENIELNSCTIKPGFLPKETPSTSLAALLSARTNSNHDVHDWNKENTSHNLQALLSDRGSFKGAARSLSQERRAANSYLKSHELKKTYKVNSKIQHSDSSQSSSSKRRSNAPTTYSSLAKAGNVLYESRPAAQHQQPLLQKIPISAQLRR